MRLREKCGCTHDGARWTHLCDEHKAATAALRAGARVDYWRSQRPDPQRVPDQFCEGCGCNLTRRQDHDAGCPRRGAP